MTEKERKRLQRSAAVAARRAIEPDTRQRWNEEIAARVLDLPEFARARVILSYCAMRGEVDPARIDAAARALGKEIAYPQCCAAGLMLAAIPDDERAMQRGVLGMMEPVPGHYSIVPPEQIDLVLVRCFAAGIEMSPMRYLNEYRVSMAAREAHDIALDAVASNAALYRAKENKK